MSLVFLHAITLRINVYRYFSETVVLVRVVFQF